MQDSEKHYPEQLEAEVSSSRARRRKSVPLEETTLPNRGFGYALIGGIVAGILEMLINVALTLFNDPVLTEAAVQGKAMSLTTAYMALGVQCLNFVISLAICFIAGFVIGKITLQRTLSFYCGAIAGIILYLGSFVTRYIPGYPGDISSTAPGLNAGAFTGGIVLTIVFFLIWCMIGGLLGRWGGWLATRRHPYYLEEVAEEEQ
ncbi:hypothetical protein EPA93_27565 [Ktedonosporobacter rubrisoli]|uniref:Uncharacterized protein n=1 Tax=Ktedonosporobacter rubrisoli TaxID=2509675 RepID=A0A4P6JVR3_KTERU|nr:hypothetical protein [Ktedonosporobacter rubrisoli]QBD79535.1 hypothetical protein EPA93_27565 [Ktedonosporobacter rubrisoli]